MPPKRKDCSETPEGDDCFSNHIYIISVLLESFHRPGALILLSIPKVVSSLIFFFPFYTFYGRFVLERMAKGTEGRTGCVGGPSLETRAKCRGNWKKKSETLPFLTCPFVAKLVHWEIKGCTPVEVSRRETPRRSVGCAYSCP